MKKIIFCLLVMSVLIYACKSVVTVKYPTKMQAGLTTTPDAVVPNMPAIPALLPSGIPVPTPTPTHGGDAGIVPAPTPTPGGGNESSLPTTLSPTCNITMISPSNDWITVCSSISVQAGLNCPLATNNNVKYYYNTYPAPTAPILIGEAPASQSLSWDTNKTGSGTYIVYAESVGNPSVKSNEIHVIVNCGDTSTPPTIPTPTVAPIEGRMGLPLI